MFFNNTLPCHYVQEINLRRFDYLHLLQVVYSLCKILYNTQIRVYLCIYVCVYVMYVPYPCFDDNNL